MHIRVGLVVSTILLAAAVDVRRYIGLGRVRAIHLHGAGMSEATDQYLDRDQQNEAEAEGSHGAEINTRLLILPSVSEVEVGLTSMDAHAVSPGTGLLGTGKVRPPSDGIPRRSAGRLPRTPCSGRGRAGRTRRRRPRKPRRRCGISC